MAPPPEMTPEEKLRRAMQLSSLGLKMKKESLRREHPGASADEVEHMFYQWLRHREEAPFGDFPGQPTPRD